MAKFKTNAPLADFVGRIPIFSSLGNESLIRLATCLRSEVFQAGTNLCVEGTTGDRLFIIETGSVLVLKNLEDGAEMEVAQLGPGDFAGEMSVFGNMLRSATLRAQTIVKAWSMDYSTFQTVLKENSDVAVAVLEKVTSRLYRETSVVAQLLGKDNDRRFRVAFFDSKPHMEEAFKRFNPHQYVYRFYETRLGIETVSLAAGANAVCVFVNDKVDKTVVGELHAMGVDMIALRCAGFNNVDLAACERFGVSVARVPAYSPYAVAEHAVALMLTLNRKTHRAHNRVREGNFALEGLVGFDMHGKTVGILGAGKIGQCAMQILRGFGCRLLVYDPMPLPGLEQEFDATLVPLEKLFVESDIITIHAPLMPATHHVINQAAIASMKNGVMIINTGRGGLVDTQALLDGLKSGQVGYAGLDVYEEESEYFFEDFSDAVLTDDLLARLLTYNNVIVTGHQGFLTREALRGITETTVANIREYQNGKKGDLLTNFVKTSPQ